MIGWSIEAVFNTASDALAEKQCKMNSYMVSIDVEIEAVFNPTSQNYASMF